MELPAGSLRFVFMRLFPGEVLFNVPGEKSEENADHEGVVNHTDAGQGLGDKVEGINQVDQSEKTAHEGAGRPLAVAAGKEVAKHGGGGPDQAGKVGQLGSGAEGIHGSLTMLNDRLGNEEFDSD